MDDLKNTVVNLKQRQGNENGMSEMEEFRGILASVTKVVSEIREIENNVAFSEIGEEERNERNDKLPEGDGRHSFDIKNVIKFYRGIGFNKLKESTLRVDDSCSQEEVSEQTFCNGDET
ncbi:hypothetical protein BpHYR1_028912 [Brachionus plicatilis]|uniref:Uncharacterized protein n=1 Tax=Brachionus plicatilis TaxID=10195 RepID=A0A3M7S1J9_BRAPC|nr:hypothetical protein BpHYR1_028912 [Brachionus plicatilis]